METGGGGASRNVLATSSLAHLGSHVPACTPALAAHRVRPDQEFSRSGRAPSRRAGRGSGWRIQIAHPVRRWIGPPFAESHVAARNVLGVSGDFEMNPDFSRELAAQLEEKVSGAISRTITSTNGRNLDSVESRLNAELEDIGIIGMDPTWVTAVAEPISRGERPEPPPIHLL
jgi:hypothetical protein